MAGRGQAPHAGHARARRQEPGHRRRRRRPRRRPRAASRGASSSTPARPASRPTTCSSTAAVEDALLDAHGCEPSHDVLRRRPAHEPRLRPHRQRAPLRAPRAACSTPAAATRRRRRRGRPRPTATSRRPSLRRRRPRRRDHAGGDLRADPARCSRSTTSTRRSRFVNARDKPLALYVFTGDDDARRRGARPRPPSGGVCVNAR